MELHKVDTYTDWINAEQYLYMYHQSFYRQLLTNVWKQLFGIVSLKPILCIWKQQLMPYMDT